MEIFGEVEQVTGWTLQGAPSPTELVAIMLRVIEAAGMVPEGLPVVSHYPNQEGKGGVGCQVYQPLTESWIMGGTWKALNRTRIVLSSCKSYDPKPVTLLLAKLIGPLVPACGGSFDM